MPESETAQVESSDIENMDEGIRGVVRVLREEGIDTISSCQGGGYAWGHGYMRPTVTFNGSDDDGPKARRIVESCGFIVFDLHRRYYENGDNSWVLEFVSGAAHV